MTCRIMYLKGLCRLKGRGNGGMLQLSHSARKSGLEIMTATLPSVLASTDPGLLIRVAIMSRFNCNRSTGCQLLLGGGAFQPYTFRGLSWCRLFYVPRVVASCLWCEVPDRRTCFAHRHTDQKDIYTYPLNTLSPKIIAHLRFPLGLRLTGSTEN